MKRILLPSLLAAALLPAACSRKAPPAETTATAPAPAEETASTVTAATPAPDNAGGNRPGSGPGGGGNFQQRAEQRMQQMKTEVGLTDDQMQKIRAITESQFASLRLGMDSSMSREDRRAAFQKAREAANAQIEPLLTAEQKPKWEAFQQQMQARRNGGGQGGEGRRKPDQQ
ncbi:MAG TPA: hypothetical protein VIM61_12150 [Chthoniobacterales bacterium]|jgi:Spy/CpxP family protein refolding chaperone